MLIISFSIFIFLYTLLSLFLDYHYFIISLNSVEKQNNKIFAITKTYPTSSNEWCKLIYTLIKTQYPTVPNECIYSAIMCDGLNEFVLKLIRSRYCYLFRYFIFDIDENVKYFVLENMKRIRKNPSLVDNL